jgi:hypothetical protein
MDMQARGMKSLVHEHALVAVALAGTFALTLAAGATLIVTGGISFGASDARLAVTSAHDGPTVERIQFVEDNVFSVSGAYVAPTSSEQIQFVEENTYLGGGEVRIPHATSQRRSDY